ncbi:sensor histidine kinase [Corynebacterium glaucum]|uniref:sensor histidine kinase n=1 Tax=Corynebacterium glaucum TaxID=187491 RepID=UPI00265AC52D|nr:histidine kinase [Corynebacterium glaucum]
MVEQLAERVKARPLTWGGAVALLAYPLVAIGALARYPLAEEWPVLLLALAFTLPLVFLFAIPELTVALSAPAFIGQIVLGRVTESEDLTSGNVVPLMGLCVIAANRDPKRTRWWTAAAVLAMTAHTWFRWNSSTDRPARTIVEWILDPIPVLLISAVPVLGAVLLGVVIRMQGERAAMLTAQAAQAERDRHLTTQLAVEQERSRIAADLHDILAHSLSVIAVQTDAAAHVLKHSPAAPPAARDAVTAAHDAAVHALQETRALVRAVGAPPEDHTPQPTLSQLPELVRSCDPAGNRFELHSTVDLAEIQLAPSAQVALYRIVQESLTNVMRHAGEDAQAQVRVTEHAGQVHVEVVDNGKAPQLDGARGHGIANMTQRARSAGGELSAGPHPERGFAVVAQVPLAVSEGAL